MEYLFPAVIFARLLQIVAGLRRFGMLIRMIPHPLELGFVHGLAIVIFMAQFGSFKSINGLGQMACIHGPAVWIMLSLIAVTMLTARDMLVSKTTEGATRVSAESQILLWSRWHLMQHRQPVETSGK